MQHTEEESGAENRSSSCLLFSAGNKNAGFWRKMKKPDFAIFQCENAGKISHLSNFFAREWLFCLSRQNIVFPLFGLGFGLGLRLGLGLGLEFGLGLGLGLFLHLRQNSRLDYFASKWQNNIVLFCLWRQNSHCLFALIGNSGGGNGSGSDRIFLFFFWQWLLLHHVTLHS